jgi:hypothetical protein
MSSLSHYDRLHHATLHVNRIVGLSLHALVSYRLARPSQSRHVPAKHHRFEITLVLFDSSPAVTPIRISHHVPSTTHSLLPLLPPVRLRHFGNVAYLTLLSAV